MKQREKRRPIQFAHPIALRSWATVAGKKESQGKLAGQYDIVLENNSFGETSWERAEQKMQQYAVELALEKGNRKAAALDFFFGGDLSNQIMATNLTARALAVPYFGLYGACSSFAEGLLLGGCLLDGGFGQCAAVCASSHHDAAERQLRFPTEMGVQRTLTAQWTVTGSGVYLLERGEGDLQLIGAIPGKVVDRGGHNQADLGSAMAAAAADTIQTWLAENDGRQSVDAIVTGDLGKIGYELCKEQLQTAGYAIETCYSDCGMQVYHEERQDVHAGGSGCGCSAIVLGAKYLSELRRKKKGTLLFVGTGALLSPTSVQQGESIPGIAHGVVIQYRQEESECCKK